MMKKTGKTKEDFKWPTEVTKKFIHIRLQHEWLFQKRKQCWSTMHGIMMENGFPKYLTVTNLRKKWSNLIDEYKRSLENKNHKWMYFDLFHSYLGKSNSMEVYPNWTDEWLKKFISIRSQNENYFDGDKNNEFDGWNEVECELRKIGLPLECSVISLEGMWNDLLRTFKSRVSPSGKLKIPWTLYEPMKKYYETNDNSYDKLRKDGAFKKSEDTDSESDNENLIEVKNKLQRSMHDDVSDNIKFEDSDFKWTPEWTKCLINFRFQNETLFKQKKQPWKQFRDIMVQNGFPDYVSVCSIRKKWTTLMAEHKRAVTFDKKWLYYDIIHSYIGEANSLDSFKNWSDDWIKKLIKIKTRHTLSNCNKKISEDRMWNLIEMDLRKENIPPECSVRNIPEIWTSLSKSFKFKHKCLMKKSTTITWPFYEDMKMFYENCEPNVLNNKDNKTIQEHKDANDSDNDMDNTDNVEFNNDVKDDLNDDDILMENMNNVSNEQIVKTELLYLTCRTCMAMSDIMLPLFKYEGETSLSDMLITLTSIQISEDDNYPQCICQTCADDLNSAFKFKKKCEETEIMLKTSWFKEDDIKMDGKKIKLEIPTNESNDEEQFDDNNGDHDFDDDSCTFDKLCDSEFINSKIMSKPYDIVIKKRKSMHKRPKQKKIKIKKARVQSKNVIYIPVVKESGETVMKRKYVYWKVCDICGKSTKHMKEHMRVHTEQKTLTCPQCPKTFKSSGGLQTHLKTHSDTPLKVCQMCGKEFFRVLTYRRHLMYHANERKYKCDNCDKTFNSADILRVHKRIHSGERPFFCKVCGKTFHTSGCVNRHMKVHKRISKLEEK